MTKSPWWYRFWIAWGLVFASLSLGQATRGASVSFNLIIAGLHVSLLVINIAMLLGEEREGGE